MTANQDVKNFIQKSGLDARSTTPEEFARFIQAELTQNLEAAKLVRFSE